MGQQQQQPHLRPLPASGAGAKAGAGADTTNGAAAAAIDISAGAPLHPLATDLISARLPKPSGADTHVTVWSAGGHLGQGAAALQQGLTHAPGAEALHASAGQMDALDSPVHLPTWGTNVHRTWPGRNDRPHRSSQQLTGARTQTKHSACARCCSAPSR